MQSAYSPKTRNGLINTQPSVAVQYFKEQCDITNILSKYAQSGVLFATKQAPQYGDFTDIKSYQEAQNALLQAQASFSALPSDIRRYFDNDPQKFVEFCMDSKNLDEMRRLGLAPEAQEIPKEILNNEGTQPSE